MRFDGWIPSDERTTGSGPLFGAICLRRRTAVDNTRMSQQAEDDWWKRLYEESGPGAVPARTAGSTLDTHFDSAVHALAPPAPPPPRAPAPPEPSSTRAVPAAWDLPLLREDDDSGPPRPSGGRAVPRKAGASPGPVPVVSEIYLCFVLSSFPPGSGVVSRFTA
ncbi:hypothetical protein SSCG_06086 [Streptomyces clavuligerus]|nr:hypothetical protein SSCG_06086 [Streptomyces clavuligerus]